MSEDKHRWVKVDRIEDLSKYVPLPDPNKPAYLDPRFQTKTDSKRDGGLDSQKLGPSSPPPERGKNWKKGQTNSQHGRRGSDRTRKQVKRLAARDGMECHWCGCWLSYDEPMRQRQRSDHDGNQLAQYPTVDHVIEWAISHDHSDSNCVLSCQPCNGARSREFAKTLNKTNNPK